MDCDGALRSAQERAISIIRRKQSAAFHSAKASGRLGEGLRCTVSSDELDVTMDMPEAFGGDGSAPSPGFFVRAGLIGCVAIGIKMTAAREGIPLEAVDVDVEMDFDEGAMFGLGDNTAAPPRNASDHCLEKSSALGRRGGDGAARARRGPLLPRVQGCAARELHPWRRAGIAGSGLDIPLRARNGLYRPKRASRSRWTLPGG
jgi:hypothetical protein